MDSIEKIYCCDRGANDPLAMAAISGQIGYSKEAVINAVNSGDCQVIQAIKDCCLVDGYLI